MPILKKYAVILFKILLGLACFLFLWLRLKDQFTNDKIENLKTNLQNPGALLALLTAFFLVIPNWLIESYKWKYITASIEKISLKDSIKGVLSGLCVGNLTPGRV